MTTLFANLTAGRRTLPLPCLFVACFATLVSGAGSALAADAAAPRLAPQFASFLREYCVRCHGSEKAESDLRLDRLEADLAKAATFDQWHKLLERIEAGEMPPEDEPQPEAALKNNVLLHLKARLDAAAAARKAEGRVVLRRLNRVEYENTVRDVFDVRVSVKEMLPEDTVALGFDNVGEALNISPVLMERYLETADAVLDAAVAPVKHAKLERQRFELAKSIPSWFMRQVYVKDDGVVLFNSRSSATALDEFRAPIPGRYKFRISAYGYQSDVPVPMAVLAGNFRTASGSARYVGYFDALPHEPKVIEFETHLENPRETIKVMPGDLPKVYLKPEAMPDYPGAGLCIQWIEVEGPLPEEDPAPSYRRVFGDVDPKSGTREDLERLLRAFAPRAFRRPATDAEVQPYIDLAAASLESGQNFEQSLRTGIKAMLCSPQFLYLKEMPGPLDGYALASRLSYFLWSTLPDDQLLQLAAGGKLQEIAVLHEQVERMLKDPRAKRFTKNFVGQWLSLRDIDATTPDAQLYPEFCHLLQWSMSQETELFFDELLTNDLSVLDFVDSDFTMLNQPLAKHYGIDGVKGVAFRRVPLKPEHHRGGVLTQASVLKVTANGTTTSPVLRGVWVLERIIGQPASPPPPNVPAVEPDIRGATTIREQLAKHRQIESCAACHAQIDPPGFALENYDVIGGWRERYRAVGQGVKIIDNRVGKIARYMARNNYGNGPEVEAGDKLPDGREFKDVEEFKKLLLSDPDQIARTVATKLTIYATGHGLEYGDTQRIEQIVKKSREAKYGLRSMIHQVVESELFRNK